MTQPTHDAHSRPLEATQSDERGGMDHPDAKRRRGTSTPQRVDSLRNDLLALAGSENALVRSAVRIALNELDLADLADDPAPHLNQVARVLDAVLNPEEEP